MEQPRQALSPEDAANRRLLMLAMVAWITDEISRLEAAMAPADRTAKPQPSTATPTIQQQQQPQQQQQQPQQQQPPPKRQQQQPPASPSPPPSPIVDAATILHLTA